MSVTIDVAYALYEKQGRRCAITGVPLRMIRTYDKDKQLHTASLDRIDSKAGYAPGNIQWVHRDINYIKQDLSVDKFIQWCQRIVGHADRKSTRKVHTVKDDIQPSPGAVSQQMQRVLALMMGHEFGLAKNVKGRPGFEHLKDVPAHHY